MAPKKKDDKGKAVEPTDSADDQKVAMETELQVAVLKSRLGRYQDVGEKLAVEGFKLADELAKQKLTLQDINEFLTNELKARSIATTQLEERVLELAKQMQDVQREAQSEVGRVRSEAAAQVEAAESRADSLAQQLSGNAEFLEKRVQLENELESLREQLAAKHKEADQKLGDLERRHLQEKEKMRQEMSAKIRETKITMAQLADQHLESSTKRTLVENEAMAAELAYQSAQSSRLAEANNTLRAETAEMRRELGIAHKTVESTARKNLLLQQTIKAILKCLQEEGPAAATAVSTAAAAAAAAGSAQQLQECVSFSLREPSADDATSSHFEQQQQELAAVCSGLVAGTSDPQQQQQQGFEEAAAVAGDIVQQLEQNVVSLTDELDAAKQALAAALQGLIPGDAAGGATSVVYSRQLQQQQETSLLFSRDSGTSSGLQQSSPKMSPKLNGSKFPPWVGRKAMVPGSPTSSSSSKMGLSTSKAMSRHSPNRQQGGLSGWDGSMMEGSSQAANAGVASALEDGVAAFVLYCVQQLRRGSTSSSAAAGAAAIGPQSTANTGSVTAGSSNVSNSACSSPTGRARQPSRAAAAVAVRSVSPSMLGPGFSAHSGIGYAAADHVAAGGGGVTAAAAAGNEAALREQLARFLLDELHGYARHKVAAYQGMQLEMPGLETEAAAEQQPQQNSLDQSPAAAAPHSADATPSKGSGATVQGSAVEYMVDSDSISHLLRDGPLVHPLLQIPGAISGPNSSRSSLASPAGPSRSPAAQAGLQQLLPLPSLLGMVQQQHQYQPQGSGGSPASPQLQARAGPSMHAAAGDAQSGVRSSTEDLFGALLSDVRPWGAGAQPGTTPSSAEVVSSSVQKDKNPRSPSPLGQNQILQVGHSASPRGPRLAVSALQASGVGLSGSNSSSTGSISAGRLVKAGGAASLTGAGLHTGSSVGKQLQQQHGQAGSRLDPPLQVNASRGKPAYR